MARLMLTLAASLLSEAWSFASDNSTDNSTDDSMSFRDQLLAQARSRIDMYFNHNSQLLPAITTPKGNMFQLSETDKACGGEGVPLFFFEVELPEQVRPVDAFNALTNTALGKYGGYATVIQNSTSRRALGFYENSSVPFLGAAETFSWVVVAANFSTQEFWVVRTTEDTEKLKQMRAPKDTLLDQCLEILHVSTSENRTRVVSMLQDNLHIPFLPMRTLYTMIGASTVDNTATSTSDRAVNQSQLGWGDEETVAPDWMFESGGEEEGDLPDNDEDMAGGSILLIGVVFGVALFLIVVMCLACCVCCGRRGAARRGKPDKKEQLLAPAV